MASACTGTTISIDVPDVNNSAAAAAAKAAPAAFRTGFMRCTPYDQFL